MRHRAYRLGEYLELVGGEREHLKGGQRPNVRGDGAQAIRRGVAVRQVPELAERVGERVECVRGHR